MEGKQLLEYVDCPSRSLQLKGRRETGQWGGEGVEGGQRLQKSLYYSRTNSNILWHKGKVRK